MKKKVFISLLAVAITAITYSVIWQQAASKFEQYLMGMIDDFKKYDADIAYDHLKVEGFPFKLVATLKNPRITKNNFGSALIKVDGNILVQTSIFNMTKVKYSTQGVTQLSYLLDKAHKPSGLLTAQQLDGEIDLWRQGFNRTAAVTLRNVQMISGETRVTAENFCLHNFQTQLPTHLKVQLTADNLMPNLEDLAPFGQKIDHMMLSLRLDLDAPTEIANISHLLEALARQGGTFEVEEAQVQWGKLNVQGNGTLTLDTAKQPLASMSVNIQGLDQALAQLVQQKHIDPHMPVFAQTILLPFKVANTQADASPQYKIPISLQEGELSIASIPFMKIPRIDWMSLMSLDALIESPVSPSPSVKSTASESIKMP